MGIIRDSPKFGCTEADDLDEDGAERPRLPRAVMDRRSRPGPEPTTLEAVGDQWRYALVVVQAGDDDDDDDDKALHSSDGVTSNPLETHPSHMRYQTKFACSCAGISRGS